MPNKAMLYFAFPEEAQFCSSFNFALDKKGEERVCGFYLRFLRTSAAPAVTITMTATAIAI